MPGLQFIDLSHLVNLKSLTLVLAVSPASLDLLLLITQIACTLQASIMDVNIVLQLQYFLILDKYTSDEWALLDAALLRQEIAQSLRSVRIKVVWQVYGPTAEHFATLVRGWLPRASMRGLVGAELIDGESACYVDTGVKCY